MDSRDTVELSEEKTPKIPSDPKILATGEGELKGDGAENVVVMTEKDEVGDVVTKKGDTVVTKQGDNVVAEKNVDVVIGKSEEDILVKRPRKEPALAKGQCKKVSDDVSDDEDTDYEDELEELQVKSITLSRKSKQVVMSESEEEVDFEEADEENEDRDTEVDKEEEEEEEDEKETKEKEEEKEEEPIQLMIGKKTRMVPGKQLLRKIFKEGCYKWLGHDSDGAKINLLVLILKHMNAKETWVKMESGKGADSSRRVGSSKALYAECQKKQKVIDARATKLDNLRVALTSAMDIVAKMASVHDYVNSLKEHSLLIKHG
ncbi:hypothetical protein AKJ16_DCAP04689 [Drosera capensis]